MLSYQVEQSLRELLMIFRTSSEFVVCSSNCSAVLCTGSDLIVPEMLEVFTGSLPVMHAAVLLKNLLISFTFPSKIHFLDLNTVTDFPYIFRVLWIQNVFVKWRFSCIYFLFDFVSYFSVSNPSWSYPFRMYFVPLFVSLILKCDCV